jgi:hypothetical protein
MSLMAVAANSLSRVATERMLPKVLIQIAKRFDGRRRSKFVESDDGALTSGGSH